MNTQGEIQIKLETLIHVLSDVLSVRIVHADYKTTQLHGGTLGDVRLVIGEAEATDGKKYHFDLSLRNRKNGNAMVIQTPGDVSKA